MYVVRSGYYAKATCNSHEFGFISLTGNGMRERKPITKIPEGCRHELVV